MIEAIDLLIFSLIQLLVRAEIMGAIKSKDRLY